MATPQESVTTVSGRRCTRSRARTAATSTSIATSAAPEVTSAAPPPPAITSQAAQVQSSAAAQDPPLPPPPPPSSTQADVPDVVSTSAAVVSSAIGTVSPVSSSAPQPSALAIAIASNAPPVGQAPTPGPPVIATPTATRVSSSAQISAAAENAAPLTTSSPTSSDSNNAAAISSSSTLANPANPAAPAVSSVQSSIEVAPEQPASSTFASNPASSDSPLNNQPQQPQSSQSGFPTGGSAGIISPEQGTGDGSGFPIASGTGQNIGSIVGGVLGGLFGLILISGLLFFCLRKRRPRERFESWRQRMSEKEEANPGFLAKTKAVPVAIGVFLAKLKRDKAKPAQNQYRSSTASSVYSATTNGARVRSISEPPSRLRQQLRDIGGRMPSLKRSRTLLRKGQDSFVVGSQSPFVGIVEDPVARNSKGSENPFADPNPEPLEPPKKFFLLNPDPKSIENSPNLQREFNEGLQDQQRAPVAPKPATMSDRGSRDPLASIIDQLEGYNGSGTPEWLKDPHKRSQSASTALQSHPPSRYPSSIYASADNPFLDPTDVPPVPTQPLPPNPPIKPTNAYYNTTANATSRASNTSFYFGEPGPSRPTTRMFATPPRRPGRQSDPFDLDRPEVLEFGAVSGRREVRASTVTRQNSRRRSSSVLDMNDNPYERASAIPGPLGKPYVKR